MIDPLTILVGCVDSDKTMHLTVIPDTSIINTGVYLIVMEVYYV